MHGYKITLAFLVVVTVIFLIIVHGCTHPANEYPLSIAQKRCENLQRSYNSRHPQNRQHLLKLGRDYYNRPFQGLGYPYGRQVASQGYGSVVVPYANTALHTGAKIWQIQEFEDADRALTKNGPSRESLTSAGGGKWDLDVLYGGNDEQYSVGKFFHFPTGDKPTWM
jgi:hypothetical protein